MKIKQVCQETGLTERTIRFYEQELLIKPNQTEMNGRNFREYNQADVTTLQTIANLRRAYFTIHEIREMMQNPGQIAQILSEYKARTQLETASKQMIVKTLDVIDLQAIQNVSELSRVLEKVTEQMELPSMDVRPNFGRFDNISANSREHEYQAYLQRENKRYELGKIFVLSIASLNVVISITSSVFNFNLFSLLIQVALSIALYAGVSWVRYWFIAGGIISILMIGMMAANGALALLEPFQVSFLLFSILFSIASSIVLIKSTAVKTFLYEQRG